MAPEPCDFPAGPAPSTGLDEELLKSKTLLNNKVRSYRNVLRDLSDWEERHGASR